MKIYFFLALLLFGCDKYISKTENLDQIKEEKSTTWQKLSEFKSNDPDLDKAVEKLKSHLTEAELEDFHFGAKDRNEDIITVILFHKDLIQRIEENKRSPDDQWTILPPFNTMPDLVKRFEYSIQNEALKKTELL